MRHSLLVAYLIVGVFSAQSQASLPDLKSALIPGATLGIRNAQLAWKVLPQAIRSCLDQSAQCGLTSQEKQILESELQNFPEELSAKTLQFMSGKEHAGHFDLSKFACGRIAVTGNTVGSPIYLNTDFLGDTQQEEVSLGSLVSLLVHELGHHQGVTDSSTRPLDALGNKVRILFQSQWGELTLAAPSVPFKLGVYSRSAAGPLGLDASFVFWDEDHTYLIPFAAQDFAQGFQSVCGSGSRMDQAVLQLANLRWLPGSPDSPTAVLDANLHCSGGANSSPLKMYLSLSFTLHKGVHGGLTLETDSVTYALRAGGDFNYEQWLEIVDLTSSPKKIKNGGSWEITGTVRVVDSLPAPIQGCGANFTSDAIQSRFESGRPLALVFDHCELTDLGDHLYRIHVKTKFPAKTPNRDYYLYSLMLLVDDERGLAGAPPERSKVTVAVRSDNPPPALHVTEVSLKTSLGELKFEGFKKYYAFHMGERFALNLKLDGITEIMNGYMSGQVFLNTVPRKRLQLDGPLGKYSRWSVDVDQFAFGASGWQVEYTMLVPDSMGAGLPVLGFKWDKMFFLTRDLREVIYTLPSNELAAFIYERIQKAP